MAILCDKNTKLLVQGLGKMGQFHAKLSLEYGTKVVGAVAPGKGGTVVDGIPVFNTVREAKLRTGANASVIFVPPPGAADAILEAADAELDLTVCITEGIPVIDMARAKAALSGTKTRLLGPNCPGVVTPGQCRIGIMPAQITRPGPVGVVSRSGTLTYEVVDLLTRHGLGQSTCVGIGGDPIIGTTFVECLREFKNDPQTRAIVICGEIGGSDEEEAAAFVAEHLPEMPVVAFIGGRNAPPGKSLGHAGAIISGRFGTAQSKVAAFKAAGVPVAERPSEIPRLVAEGLAVRT